MVVDSIRKLVPEKLWKNLTASLTTNDPKKDKGIDGFGGRAGQIKAALNAAWVDELIPLLADTRMALVVIARETKDAEAEASLFSSRDWKVGGGAALFYDSSLDIRVSRDWVYEEIGGKKVVVGEKRRLAIHKTKVAGKEQKVPTANFYTSNGKLSPLGFDPARDVVELAVALGVIEQRGAWFSFGGSRLGQGQGKVLTAFREKPELLAEVQAAVRAHP